MTDSDGTPNIPPIFDPEHSQIIQPMKPLSMSIDHGGILIDDELVARATRDEVYVYVHLVRLAREARTAPAVMPPLRVFAKQIKLDHRPLRRALQSLHDIGWILITNMGGRDGRFRVIVKEPVMRLVREMSNTELIEREVRKRMRQLSAAARDLQDDIITNPSFSPGSDTNVVNKQPSQAPPEENSPFPPQICELIASIPHVDKRGKRLANYPQSIIHAKAHHAPISDIETGLVNLYGYEPSAKHGGKVGSIIATWAAMFALDQQGKGTLKMRGNGTTARSKLAGISGDREQEFQRAVCALIERRPIYVGHLDMPTLTRARDVDALMKCPANDEIEQLRETCYAELDEQGYLQFHHYTREEIERGNLALESLTQKMTSPTTKEKPGAASQ